MPFPVRVISKRVNIDEVFNGSTDNILQKTSVSNLIGLLNQLNQISLHANSIFTDILHTTSNTNNRIKTVKQRLKNIQSRVPTVENILISNAPSYFYDNPYSGKEYIRNDPLNGLLFSRKDSTTVVNQRRNIAEPPANLSTLDTISINNGKGPCIKRFTDPNFFIDEWLENEKRKREKAREQRRKDRQNRKKKRMLIRKQNKKIKKIQRKRWDDQGNEILDDGPTEITIKQQYQLTDDTNRNVDALLSKKKKKINKKVETNKHSPMVSYNIPPQPPIPPIPSQEMKQPPPNPMMYGNVHAPPPNPLQLKLKLSQSMSEKSQAKLRDLSANVPMNINDVPVTPQLGFLGDIQAFNKKGKLKMVEVNRSRWRFNFLDELKKNKVKLISVNLRKIAPKKEEKKNLIFVAMEARRRHMGDSSSDEESDWGSESDSSDAKSDTNVVDKNGNITVGSYVTCDSDNVYCVVTEILPNHGYKLIELLENRSRISYSRRIKLIQDEECLRDCRYRHIMAF